MSSWKQGSTVPTKTYFEKRLERVRESSLSERRFYQKITDICATAVDFRSDGKGHPALFRGGAEQDALQRIGIRRRS